MKLMMPPLLVSVFRSAVPPSMLIVPVAFNIVEPPAPTESAPPSNTLTVAEPTEL